LGIGIARSASGKHPRGCDHGPDSHSILHRSLFWRMGARALEIDPSVTHAELGLIAAKMGRAARACGRRQQPSSEQQVVHVHRVGQAEDFFRGNVCTRSPRALRGGSTVLAAARALIGA
jgi:hypothetical protein